MKITDLPAPAAIDGLEELPAHQTTQTVKLTLDDIKDWVVGLLAAVATSGSASDLGTGTLPAARIGASSITTAKLSMDADLSMASHKLTNVTDPSAAQDAATKAYVDAVAIGLDPKPSVRAATTANITLSGAQTIDGVSVIAGDRVLVKDQTTGANNGIYVAAAGAWARASDADTSAEVTAGTYCFVTEGTSNGDKGFVLTTNDPITLGTTALVFAQFSGGGGGSAGGSTGQVQYNNAGAFGGDSGFTYDAANQRVQVGTATTTANRDVYVQKTVNGLLSAVVENLSTGTAGNAQMIVANSANVALLGKYSTGFTTAGLLVADSALLYNASGILNVINAAAQPMIFAIGGTAAANEVFRLYAASNGDIRAQLTGAGNVSVGQRGVVYQINNTYVNGFQGVTIALNGAGQGAFHCTSASYAGAAGLFGSLGVYLYALSGQTGGLWIGNADAAGFVAAFTGGSATTNERMRIYSTGAVCHSMDGTALTSTESANFRGTHNSRHCVTVDQLTNGTLAYAGFAIMLNGVGATDFTATPASFTPAGMFVANASHFNAMLSGGMDLVASHASGEIRMGTGGSAANNERMRIYANGDIKFFNAGTQKFHWDMTNARFNFGEAATTAGNDFYYLKTQNATTGVFFQNSSTGTAGRCSVAAYNSAQAIGLFKYSTGFTTSGLEVASLGLLFNGSGVMALCNGTANDMIFTIGGLAAANEAMRITSTGPTVAIGHTASSTLNMLWAKRSFNGQNAIVIENSSNGTAAYAACYAINDAGANAGMLKVGSGYTTAGLLAASMNMYGGSTGATLLFTSAAADIIFANGGTAAANERMRIDANGNVSLGTAALATTATDGFLYLDSCAGTPSGVPTSKTGRVPVVIDTTGSKLWAYIGGAWKSAALI